MHHVFCIIGKFIKTLYRHETCTYCIFQKGVRPILGVHGKILVIDLNTGESTTRSIPGEICRKYLGGKGLGTYLLNEYVEGDTDPLSEKNCLIFTVGPLTDSGMFGSNRYGVFSKSPLTGCYAESYSGGNVAPAMKRTGYDAIVIKGKCQKPSYLVISDAGISLKDAGNIWGLDTYRAQDMLLKEVGKENARAVVIGPAGENLVRFACIENDYWRSAGRTGLGAVMGSKKLKGIVFYGDSRPQLNAPEKLKEYYKDFAQKNKDDKGVNSYKTYGTTALVSLLNSVGGFPTNYWRQGTASHWKQISGEYLLENFEVKSRSCPPCLMSCGKLTRVKSGKYEGLTVEGPEYETIYAFGGLCNIEKLEDIIYLNDLCDRYGIDTISTGNIIAFALYAAEKKLLELPAGSRMEQVVQLIESIVRRQGIGAKMAEGIKLFSRDLGLEDEAVHVKGLEPAGYDPRRLKGMGLAYATSTRGACHLRATFYKPELAGMIDPQTTDGKARLFVDFEDRLAIFDALIMCRFYRDIVGWGEIKDLLELVTGHVYSIDEMRAMASCIITETRRFNYKCGLSKKDDELPKVFFEQPLGDKGYVLTEDEMEKMLTEYYLLRGWDKDGNPF